MTIQVIDYKKVPKDTKGDKEVFFSSPEYHVWMHGPNDPGDKGPMHKHTEDEVFFCVTGECKFNFPDRPSAILTPGMMIIIPKGDFYQVEAAGTEKMRLFGTRCAPFGKPRFTEKGETVVGDVRFKAGATY